MEGDLAQRYLCKRDDSQRFAPPGHTKTESWPLVRPNDGSRNVSVQVSEMKAGGAAFKHAHGTSEQIYIVLSGKAEMVVGGETLKVAKGDVVYVPANIEHDARVIGKQTFKSIVVFVPPL